MEAIFGKTDIPELFAPQNSIFMSKAAEVRFDKGYFVIVPRISDDASSKEIGTWHSSEPKEYQIRIIEHDVKEMSYFTDATSQQRWRELNGHPVTFRSNFRPRARYLYFHYCVTMLRRSWTKEKPTNALRDELGRLYWGTPGGVVRRNMLLAFVEEMGHEYEALLDGAFEESGDVKAVEVVETALAAANNQIKLSTGGKEGLSYGDDETDDKEDEHIVAFRMNDADL